MSPRLETESRFGEFLTDDRSPMTEARGKGRTKGGPSGPRALAAVLPKVAEPALRKRGFSAVEIIANWREIVGPDLAAETSPERLAFPRGARSGGTLHVTAAGSVALEIQHLEPLILERINRTFGYAAVSRIALTQGPRRSRPDRGKTDAAKPPAVDAQRRAAIDAGTQDIASEPLRTALRDLGKAVATGQTRPGQRGGGDDA